MEVVLVDLNNTSTIRWNRHLRRLRRSWLNSTRWWRMAVNWGVITGVIAPWNLQSTVLLM